MKCQILSELINRLRLCALLTSENIDYDLLDVAIYDYMDRYDSIRMNDKKYFIQWLTNDDV